MKPDPVQVAETLGRFVGSQSYPRPEFLQLVHTTLLDLIQENQDLKAGPPPPVMPEPEQPEHIQAMSSAELKEKLDEAAKWFRERHYPEAEKPMSEETLLICAMCREEFRPARSDEEAMEEYRKNFPDADADEPMEVVCDDCYKEMTAQISPEKFRQLIAAGRRGAEAGAKHRQLLEDMVNSIDGMDELEKARTLNQVIEEGGYQITTDDPGPHPHLPPLPYGTERCKENCHHDNRCTLGEGHTRGHFCRICAYDVSCGGPIP